MAKEFNERIDCVGGLRVPSGANTGLSATSDSTGNLSWIASGFFAGQVAPTPPTGYGEYVWFVTDGAGGITDIRSGKT